MSVGLFTGIETYSWSEADFHAAAFFLSENDIDTWYLKVYEITQGEWYTSLGGSLSIMTTLQKMYNLKIVPYGFFYGDDPVQEGQIVSKYLTQWGVFCVDLEGSFDNVPEKMQKFYDQFSTSPGQLQISTWANPNTHQWTQNLKILDKFSNLIWMPQCYDDSLLKEFYSQWIPSTHPVQPTFHLVNTPYNDAKSFPSFSLWEYQLATSNIGTLRSYIETARGNQVGNYPTNNLGMIANFLPTSEFQPGKSEFECGAFAVSLCGRATNYNISNGNDPQRVIQWAEEEYAKTTGSNGPSNMIGASIDDMHVMLKDTQTHASVVSPPNILHWWDIVSITANSTQGNDIGQIKAAIEHGYAVIATVSESSVHDVQLGKNPYWWGASGNHILTYVGISKTGNLLAVDPANVYQSDLQGVTKPLPWPREYDIRYLDNSWATIVKFPWLPDIKDGNPLGWPPYSVTPPPPPPDTIVAVNVTYDENSKQLIFSNNNQVVYRQNV
jgi:hypothetical protein